MAMSSGKTAKDKKEQHEKEKLWAKTMQNNADKNGKLNMVGKLAEINLMRSLDNNGLFDRAVKQSSISSAMPDKIIAKNYAMTGARKLILENYNPDSGNNVRTYLDTSLAFNLRSEKYKNKGGAVFMGDAHEKHMEVIANVQNHIKLTTGKEPTAHDIYSALQSGVSTAGRGITLSEISKALKLTRKHLSGDVVIGSDAAGGAESISLEDVVNVDKLTPEQLRNNASFKNSIEKEIETIKNKHERIFLRSLYGIGQFSKTQSKTLNAAAMDSGLTNYQAKKVEQDFRQKLKTKGIL